MIELIPILNDNYTLLLTIGNSTVVIDPGEAAPVLAALKKNNLSLDAVLSTHMHPDHCGGNLQLKKETGCRVYGGDKRISGIDQLIDDSNQIKALGFPIRVFRTPGHTLGDCSYYFKGENFPSGMLFTGDALFAGGCGRIFEGTAEMLYRSLRQFAVLPGSTQLYCAHEYTLDNYRFALSLQPENNPLHKHVTHIEKRRAAKQPTLPVTLEEERLYNPFLRTDDPELKKALNMAGAEPQDVFAEIRMRKDNF